MSTQDNPPPGKIPMSPQASLASIIIGVFALLFFAVLALLSLRLHMRLVALGWACMGVFSMAGMIDSLKKRRTILQGGQVFVPAPPDIHIRRAQMTISLVSILPLNVIGTGYLIWANVFDRETYDTFLWGLMAFFWAAWIGLYFLAASKHLPLWSSLPQDDSAQAISDNNPLPPLTARGMTRPMFSVIGFGLSMGCFVGIQSFWSGGHFLIGRLLLALGGGLAGGIVLALLYLALVVAVRGWNARMSRSVRQNEDLLAEQVWPPSPRIAREEDNDNARL